MPTVRHFNRKIGITPGGMPIQTTFTEIKSGKQGPHLYIQSGIHGGELTYWVLFELFQFFTSNTAWRGKITLVGVANPISWSQRTYYSTNGKFDLYDGHDWNRNFPGNAQGSLAQRITDALFSVAQSADLAIDLHTSRNSPPFNIVCDEKSLELACANGIPYIFRIDQDQRAQLKYRGTFALALQAAGVANLSIECGAHDSDDSENNRQVLDALLALAAEIGLLEPSARRARRSRKTLVYSEYVTYFAPNGGYVRYEVMPGKPYKSGQLLYRLYSPTLFSSQDVMANEDGIAMKLSPTHIMHPGDEVYQCVKR